MAILNLITTVLIVIIALLHVYILVLEMFLWEKPIGLKAFRNTLEAAKITRTLAANQGLYNGFLAAGLVWGLVSGNTDVKLFFLSCVFVAGVYGGFTAIRKILYIQALPAGVAIVLLLASTMAISQ
jgi:putative membrane protein